MSSTGSSGSVAAPRGHAHTPSSVAGVGRRKLRVLHGPNERELLRPRRLPVILEDAPSVLRDREPFPPRPAQPLRPDVVPQRRRPFLLLRVVEARSPLADPHRADALIVDEPPLRVQIGRA